MPHLQTKLQSWRSEGHSIAEFSKATGIPPAYCSQIFSGKRFPSRETIHEILNGVEAPLGMEILRAWMLDHLDLLPPEFRHRIQILIQNLDEQLNEDSPLDAKKNNESAKKWAMDAMDSDPDFMEIIRRFWKLVGSPKM